MKPLTIAVIGAGNRGREIYGGYALEHPHEVRVHAIAEPDETRRNLMAEEHQIPKDRQFSDWRQLTAQKRVCDAALICTGDRDHADAVHGCIERGYHVLLEKPIAADPVTCREVIEHAESAGVILTVAHVLRYTSFFSKIKELLDQKAVGQLTAVQHNENIGYFHFAHSYVRGNWRRSDISSPLILAKSCHDLDLLYWFADAPCRSVSSSGSLSHFRTEAAPEGAREFCLDGCPHLRTCPYAADRIYLPARHAWPATVISADQSLEACLQALREGPYGRCVYYCDNDVVDHQESIFTFENGVSASFVLSAFTHDTTRTMKLMGTHGEIRAHFEKQEIELLNFSDRSRQLFTPSENRSAGSHGGGDAGLMSSFIKAVRTQDRTQIFPARDALVSHQMAFAAESSRISGKTVRMDELSWQD